MAGHDPFECLLPEKKLATLLSLKPATLRRWRTEGFGPPFFKVGRYVRYRLSEAKAWLEANKHTSTTYERPDRKPHRRRSEDFVPSPTGLAIRDEIVTDIRAKR